MKTFYVDPPTHIAPSHIKVSAKRLSGKYLRINKEGNYCFQHRVISESVMISCSIADPEKVIPLLRFDFLTEMARPQKYLPRKGEVIFSVPDKLNGMLAQRILELFEQDYEKDLILFIQNLCKAKIMTMTSNNILQEIVAKFKYIKKSSHSELLHDYRLAGRPYYISNISHLHLPSALMMFCNINTESVYKCLYDTIHNTLITDSEGKELGSCIDTLVTAFNFAVCALDKKRATEILKILKDHDIKQKELSFDISFNLVKGHGLPAVKLMYSLPDLYQVFDITILLSEIFKSLHLYTNYFDENMKEFIALIIESSSHGTRAVKAIVKYVCSQGPIDFIQEVCTKYDSSLLDIDDMIKVECKGRRVEVVTLQIEMYQGKYDVQKALEDACMDAFTEGVQVILDKAERSSLDMSAIMNNGCRRGNIDLVKWLCKMFDSSLYSVREAMNHTCLSGQIDLVNWLCEMFDHDLFDMKTALINASSSEDSMLVQWLLEKFENDLFDMKSAMDSACRSGNMQLVKWFVENFHKDVFNFKTAMNEACTKRDNIELVQWLFEKFEYKEFDMNAVMKNACSNMWNASLVRWLCKTFDNDLFDMKVVMDYSGSRNQTEYGEWLCGDYTVLFY